MIKQKKVVAIIPARGGSKGIPGKNLKKVGRYSLLERAILLAKQCPDRVDEVIVTTDSQEMHDIALRYGVAAPTIRPSALAGDFVRSSDVLIHIINQCHLENDYILMLQPTSPLRTASDLRAVVDLLDKNLSTCDAVASVTELASTHPDKVQQIIHGYLAPFIPGVIVERPRQELRQAYRLNGAFYFMHASTILNEKTILPKRTIPFVMPQECSVNLDTMLDWYLLEALIEKKIITLEEYDAR